MEYERPDNEIGTAYEERERGTTPKHESKVARGLKICQETGIGCIIPQCAKRGVQGALPLEK